MENFSYHVPFYVVTGGVDLAGHSSELTPGQVGLFDRQTWSVATQAGQGKEFFFAQGHNGGKDWNLQNVSESHKSPFFLAKDVENIWLSRPVRLQNEEWVIGFNGSTSSKGLTFQKGKATRVKLYFFGQPTYRFFGGPKEYVVSYTPPVDCVEPCTEPDCEEPIVDCLVHTQALINQINEHVELQKFGVRAQLVNAPFTAATPNMEKYCLTICDNGDVLSLQKVQAQAPAGVTVERISRAGAMSTYQFCQPMPDAAPADFTQTGSVLQAVCENCPSGSSLVAASDVYMVKRILAAGTSLVDDAARDTFADAVGTTYGANDAGSTFQAQDGALGVVKIKVAKGTAVTASGSDVVEFSHTEEAQCVFANPAPIAWGACGTGVRSSRTLRINNLRRPDCDTAGDRLEDLEVMLAGVKGIKIDTLTKIAGVACVDDYTVEQWSNDCVSEEDCISNEVTFTYDKLPAIEGNAWEVIPPVVSENAARKCGIRISAGYVDPKSGNCFFDIKSYFEVDPIRMEVSLLNEDEGACDVSKWPTVHQSKVARQARQSGEEIVREAILKDHSYLKHLHGFSEDPLERDRFGNNIVERVDRNAFYNLYYVTFKASYGFQTTFRKNEQEKFTAVFAFKEGDASAKVFEDRVLSVLEGKSGVPMHIVDGDQKVSSGSTTTTTTGA